MLSQIYRSLVEIRLAQNFTLKNAFMYSAILLKRF